MVYVINLVGITMGAQALERFLINADVPPHADTGVLAAIAGTLTGLVFGLLWLADVAAMWRQK